MISNGNFIINHQHQSFKLYLQLYLNSLRISSLNHHYFCTYFSSFLTNFRYFNCFYFYTLSCFYFSILFFIISAHLCYFNFGELPNYCYFISNFANFILLFLNSIVLSHEISFRGHFIGLIIFFI
jgi:hypothetical protein